MVMAKEKVTLTLDVSRMQELRKVVDSRSLSAAVDSAVAQYLDKLRHLAAVDVWLSEMEREYGPVPTEALEWAAQVVERWDASRSQPTRRS
jgi:hypothetical protein